MSGVYVNVLFSQQFGRDQKLEFSLDLRGGSVDWASKDKSSKKQVLEVNSLLETNLNFLLLTDYKLRRCLRVCVIN